MIQQHKPTAMSVLRRTVNHTFWCEITFHEVVPTEEEDQEPELCNVLTGVICTALPFLKQQLGIRVGLGFVLFPQHSM